MKEIIDVAIIGAGPAGMSAGIYLGRGGKSVVLFEKLAAGGQAALTHSIDNYPGFENGINGMELTDKMRQQVERFSGKFVYDSVEKFTYDDHTKQYTIVTGMETEYKAKIILITTGTTSKRLGVKGEEKFFGRGIGTCAVCDGAFYKDQEVAIIGGGNSALEEALYLAEITQKVYIIHRRQGFRAEKIVQEHALANPKIEFILDTVVEEFIGEQKLEKLILKNVKSNELSELNVKGVFLYVGLDANTEFVPDKYKDSQGFIMIDQYNKINDEGLFAAGDCCAHAIKQVAIACGEGVKTSYSILEFLSE